MGRCGSAEGGADFGVVSALMSSSIVGINSPAVTEWMVENIGVTAPVTFDLIAGGR